MSTCGLSPPFGRLSPTTGQIAYALLSRPPLTRRSVRLACVKRAASVRPEPGSNPHEKNSFQVNEPSACVFIQYESLALPSTIQLLRYRLKPKKTAHRTVDARIPEPRVQPFGPGDRSPPG